MRLHKSQVFEKAKRDQVETKLIGMQKLEEKRKKDELAREKREELAAEFKRKAVEDMVR